MKTSPCLSILLLAIVLIAESFAQGPRPGPGGGEFRRPGPPLGGGPGGRRQGGPRPEQLGVSDLGLGEAGIAWYPKMEDGLAEAKRRNRPILFMAVASQCGGVPGVF